MWPAAATGGPLAHEVPRVLGGTYYSSDTFKRRSQRPSICAQHQSAIAVRLLTRTNTAPTQTRLVPRDVLVGFPVAILQLLTRTQGVLMGSRASASHIDRAALPSCLKTPPAVQLCTRLLWGVLVYVGGVTGGHSSSARADGVCAWCPLRRGDQGGTEYLSRVVLPPPHHLRSGGRCR